MQRLRCGDSVVTIPAPVYVVIEDVGWWQGADGSAVGQPYRSRFVRYHCLEDYRVLEYLARRLDMRLGLGLVIGEWDRTDCLRNVPGATWQAEAWDNSANRGPWLEEAAAFLRESRDLLEIGLHGLCHEFWQNGHMSRTEFHDSDGFMRPPEIIRAHLDAFARILVQQGITRFPRLFIPPALHHSFGNGTASMQHILAEYGIEYVITSFARARRYRPPHHPAITWEEGVALLERGEAPVGWDDFAAEPPLGVLTGPVVPLHWSNLLHPDPAGNREIAERWARRIVEAAQGPDRILARDVSSCFRQVAAAGLGRLAEDDGRVIIDLARIPALAALRGPLSVSIRGNGSCRWRCCGASIAERRVDDTGTLILTIVPSGTGDKLRLEPERP